MDEARGLVMVVEDEPAIASLIRLYLSRAGFGVHNEFSGETAFSQIKRLHPVAIVLDVGLPGIDGIEICRRLREQGDWTPIIFVTARDDEVDRVLGLELGADDYVTKPFSPRELVARVKGLMRRASGSPGPRILTLGGLSIDPSRRQVTVSGRAVGLTATEFDLLAYLMSQPGRVFSREQLLAAVWGQAGYTAGRTVDVHIAQLRSKLGVSSPIRTSRGVGYSVDLPSADRP